MPFDRQSAPEIVKNGDFWLKRGLKQGKDEAADQFSDLALNLYTEVWQFCRYFEVPSNEKNKRQMSEIRYSIEARAYDIVGLAAHDFWVLRDENWNVLGQLHGLATNTENKIKPIGTIGDKLKFYHFGFRAILLGLNPDCNLNYIKAGQKSKLVFSGSPDDVLGRWDNAVTALPYLNSLSLSYTPFAILGLVHINSNTAYTLLGKLMGIPAHIFSGYWQPGWRNTNKVLTCSQLESILNISAQNNINSKNFVRF